MISWLSLAFASGLDVERAENAIAEGRAFEAITAARSAIATSVEDGEAWTVYLIACGAAGLDLACRSEAGMAGEVSSLMALRLARLAGKEIEVPEISSEEWRKVASGSTEGVDNPLAQTERVAGLALDHPDRAAELALEILDSHPDRPDILAGLFDVKVPPVKSIATARKKAVKLGEKRIKKADAAELYRWLALWVATDQHTLATQTADLIAVAGEARPMDRKPLTRAEQVRRAVAVIAGEAQLLVRNPGEHESVAVKVGQELAQRGKLEDAAEALHAARAQSDTLSLAIAEAEAQLAIREYDVALTYANEALVMSADVLPGDRAGLSAPSRSKAVAIALALRGRVHLAAGDNLQAVVDLMLANQLAPVDAGPLEKAMGSARYQLETIKAELDTRNMPAHEVGMEAARKSMEAGELDGALSMVNKTIAGLCLPSHSKARLSDPLLGRPFLAEALALRAEIGQAAGRNDEARADIFQALLLRRWSAPASWWARLAGLQEAPEAKFFADSMAAALDEERERTAAWPGQAAGADAAASALVAEWMRGAPDEIPEGGKVTRGTVITFARKGQGGRRAGRPPALNHTFPAFSLETPHGRVALRQGGISLITFFRADSPNSRRAMRELSVMAQTWRRKEGVDVIVVGVSIDPKEESLTNLAGERDTWGPNGWDPEMGKRFGVHAVPTTFVVDTEGTTRFVHVGYLGTSEYEAELRLLAGI